MKTKLARTIRDMTAQKQLTQTGLVNEAGCPIGNRHRLARLMGGQAKATETERDWLCDRLKDNELFAVDGKATLTAPTRLEKYRTERDLTHEGMALKIGIAAETYEDIECGKCLPTDGTRERIAKVLGRSQWEIFDKHGYARVDVASIATRQEQRGTAPAVAAS